MKTFWFTIKGTMDKDVSDKLWKNLKGYNVNLTVLEERAYIYGQKSDEVIAEILELVLGFDLRVDVEVGSA